MKTTIFFDFDGVLAESVNIKTEAFYKLYEQFGKAVAKNVVAHHLANGGVSRFEKIKHYHNEFLGIELSEPEIDKWANEFSSLVLNGVINAKEVPGAKYFLNKYIDRFDYWVISGTPTNELRTIVEKRGMSAFFKGVYGSPEKKGYWVDHIIEQHKLNVFECVFIGDATADFEAAHENDIDFILRKTPDNESYFKDIDVIKFSDFYELEKLMPQWQ